LIYFLTGYDSAFEADQNCHSYLSSYDNSSGNFGCDHDTETHQRILYESKESKEPAKIIKKFRYKFLYINFLIKKLCRYNRNNRCNCESKILIYASF